jgi:hypothetical protein
MSGSAWFSPASGLWMDWGRIAPVPGSGAPCCGAPAATYVGGLLGPIIVTAAGLGMLFMPLTLVALNKVQERDAGVASSLVNTGQQVGGSCTRAAGST